MSERTRLTILATVQVFCTFAILSTSLHLWFDATPLVLSMDTRLALIPLQAAILGVSLFVGWTLYRGTVAHCRSAEERLKGISEEFLTHIENRFSEWGLTPAEHDVALFTVKGFSIAEIASLRETSEGTVKAQTAAIYRKADVSGRPQLLSLFIEDLLGHQMRNASLETSSEPLTRQKPQKASVHLPKARVAQAL